MNTLLDLRVPIGAILALYGLVLTIWGFIADPSLNQRSLGININLWWGLVLTIVGVLFLIASRKGTHK